MLQIFGDSPVGRLVEGIRTIVNPEGVKREKLLQEFESNPELARQLAEARRRQFMNMNEPEQAGNIGDANFDVSAPLIASLGLDPTNMDNRAFIDQMAVRFPASFDENVNAGLAVDEEATSLGVDTTKDKLRSEGATAQATTTAEQNRRRFEQRRGVIGSPEREADLGLEAAQHQVRHLQQRTIMNNFGITDAGLQEKINLGYDAYRDTLSPEMRGIADTAFRNPNFLRHLQFSMELDFRRRAQALQAQTDAIERAADITAMYTDVLDFQEKMAEALNNDEFNDEQRHAFAAIARDRQRILEQIGLSHIGGLLTPTIIEYQESGWISGDEGTATTLTPPRGAPIGGGEPTGLLDTEAAGKVRSGIEAGKAAAFQIASEEGIDAAMAELYANPDQETKDFIEALKADGQWESFLGDLQKRSREAREAREQSFRSGQTFGATRGTAGLP